MMLVVSDEMTEDALSRQKCSYAAWIAFADSLTCPDVPAIDEELIDESSSNNFLKPTQ